MNLESTTDEQLMVAMGTKDVSALEVLFDRHHRVALAVANRVVGDPAKAEDVVQEAFLAIWKDAASYRAERGKAKSWLLTVVRHRAIDVTRGKGYSTPVTSLEELVVHPSTENVWPEVSRNIDAEELRNALQTLPAEQRQAITEAYFEGYTNREIAERANVALGTVKGRIRLGMNKLRQIVVSDHDQPAEDND